MEVPAQQIDITSFKEDTLIVIGGGGGIISFDRKYFVYWGQLSPQQQHNCGELLGRVCDPANLVQAGEQYNYVEVNGTIVAGMKRMFSQMIKQDILSPLREIITLVNPNIAGRIPTYAEVYKSGSHAAVP